MLNNNEYENAESLESNNTKTVPFADDIIVFETLNCENADKLIQAGKKCPYLLSCYSPGCLIMWKEHFNASFVIKDGCVIIKVKINNKEYFLFPYEFEPDADINNALFAIERYAAKNSIPFAFLGLQRSVLPLIAARYKSFSVFSNRNQSDYIYLSKDMQTFAGRKYSGQRNHINKFNKLHPDAVFRELTDSEEDRAKLDEFWVKFESTIKLKRKLAIIELSNAKRLFSRRCVKTAHKACIELNGEIIAVCFGEVFSNMLIIHVEKALRDFNGIYPFMVTSFAKEYGKDVKYINREDDAGSRGLRISKMQYQPSKIVENLLVEINTELNNLKKTPAIKTDRLLIDPINQQDIDQYNKLCVDDEHNKLWGYDYRSNLEGELTRDYFYKAVVNDFINKTGMSLAVRYNDEFIGETVINEFDFRGSANIGIRILPEFTSKGFGKEAFAAISNFALYGLGLTHATAYCYKENIPSYKMLSSFMTLTNEDDKYYYFEKSL